MLLKRFSPMKSLALLAVFVLVAVPRVVAQEGQEGQYFELLRADLKTKRVAILTETLQLTDDQGATFWPIYREHQLAVDKLADRRLATIKEFAANYEAMTPEVAKDLADRSFKFQEDRLKLLKSTYGKVAKELGPIVAGRFAQVEYAINTLIDVQISAELPLIQ
jgi:hypothetical protein